jgi:hypothetical protein
MVAWQPELYPQIGANLHQRLPVAPLISSTMQPHRGNTAAQGIQEFAEFYTLSLFKVNLIA